MQLITINARIVYNPKRQGLKKIRTANEHYLIAEVDNGLGMYYRWWLMKRFGLRLNPPAYGCHVTVLDGRQHVKPELEDLWKKYDGQQIQIAYSPEVYQQWKFWCLPVMAPKLMQIRHELGFNPHYPFHITIGRMD